MEEGEQHRCEHSPSPARLCVVCIKQCGIRCKAGRLQSMFVLCGSSCQGGLAPASPQPGPVPPKPSGDGGHGGDIPSDPQGAPSSGQDTAPAGGGSSSGGSGGSGGGGRRSKGRVAGIVIGSIVAGVAGLVGVFFAVQHRAKILEVRGDTCR